EPCDNGVSEFNLKHYMCVKRVTYAGPVEVELLCENKWCIRSFNVCVQTNVTPPILQITETGIDTYGSSCYPNEFPFPPVTTPPTFTPCFERYKCEEE